MLRRRPSSTARAAGALLCLIAIAAPPFLRWAALPSQRSTARLRGVTFGQRHRLIEQIPLGRLGALPWPPGDGKLVGSYDGPPGHEELAIWLSPRHTAERDQFWNLEALCFDAHGCQIGGPHWPNPVAATWNGSRDLAVVGLDAFPRNVNPVTLRFYDRDSARAADSIDCISPRVAPAPQLDFEVPVQTSVGSSCRLERLAGGITWAELKRNNGEALLRAAERAERRRGETELMRGRWTVGGFRVAFRDRSVVGWKPDRITLADATGNRVPYPLGDPWNRTTPVSELCNPEGVVTAAVPVGLCLEEKLWKVRARFCYFGSEVFENPEVTVRSPLLPVSTRWPAILWSHTGEDPYLKVEVRSRTEHDAHTYVERPGSREVTVDAFVSAPTGQRVRLWARAEDERGRPLAVALESHPNPGASACRWVWRMELPRSSRSVRVTLAGWPSRAFDLEASPAAGLRS